MDVMPSDVHVQEVLAGRPLQVNGHVRHALCAVLLLELRHGHPVWRRAVMRR